jgi:hypothetical protein
MPATPAALVSMTAAANADGHGDVDCPTYRPFPDHIRLEFDRFLRSPEHWSKKKAKLSAEDRMFIKVYPNGFKSSYRSGANVRKVFLTDKDYAPPKMDSKMRRLKSRVLK